LDLKGIFVGMVVKPSEWNGSLFGTKIDIIDNLKYYETNKL